jgi:hypothetical protein
MVNEDEIRIQGYVMAIGELFDNEFVVNILYSIALFLEYMVDDELSYERILSLLNEIHMQGDNVAN